MKDKCPGCDGEYWSNNVQCDGCGMFRSFMDDDKRVYWRYFDMNGMQVCIQWGPKLCYVLIYLSDKIEKVVLNKMLPFDIDANAIERMLVLI